MNSKFEKIERASLVLGLVIGSVMLVSVVAAFFQDRGLSPGGVALALVGFSLLGLSIWGSVELRAGPKGGIEAVFTRFKDEVREDIASHTQRSESLVNEIKEIKEELRASFLGSLSKKTAEELKTEAKVNRLV